MKKYLIALTGIIALCLSANGAMAGTGYTVLHQLTVTGIWPNITVTKSTTAPFKNGTNFDKSGVSLNGGAYVYSGLWVHRDISWKSTDPKIGTVTPNTNGGGGSGGGGGGKLHGPVITNGYTVVYTEPNTRSVSTFFVADPWTCGTIFYSLGSDGVFHYDTKNFVPCGGTGTIPSSGLTTSPYVWKPEWKQDSDNGPVQKPLTDEIRKQVQDIYGFWPN